MAGRRKSRCLILDEGEDFGEAGVAFNMPDEGPFMSADGTEDTICGRCERTILFGISRSDASLTIKRQAGFDAGTAAADRPIPLLVACDCGAINRIWPHVPS